MNFTVRFDTTNGKKIPELKNVYIDDVLTCSLGPTETKESSVGKVIYKDTTMRPAITSLAYLKQGDFSTTMRPSVDFIPSTQRYQTIKIPDFSRSLIRQQGTLTKILNLQAKAQQRCWKIILQSFTCAIYLSMNSHE